ncbi:hypothetical protein CARUB_v10014833mg [Capsella rubella]|uniref:Uncharacterized protein n=1 Tax=Capsella rubella TaxID=81985 RepID=R0I5J7_9BRAS|nr:multiple organellar RNA editing factor 8, chloroplastic/mitochondrial [Capsella rubella]EOA31633.1 hypothetical protein CARUB_v10014833mg [Capsella rubella]
MEATRFSALSALLLLFMSLPLSVTSKDQTVSCTMCSSCDNPCNPVSSSYPPPPPSSGGGGSYYYSPPPPPPSSSGGSKYPPPYGGDGGQGYYYPPPYNGGYGMPSPPNPIVPYFPFYYHTPPQGHGYSDSGSDRLQGRSLLFALFAAVLLCFV